MNDELQLMNYLHFDQSELAANRHGRLSPKQEQRLKEEERTSKGCSSFLGVFLILVGLGPAALVIAMTRSSLQENMTEALIFLAGFGCIWPIVWGSIGFFQLRSGLTKMKIQVRKAEGPINIVKSIRSSYNSSTHMTSEYSVYELYVGGRVLEVDSGLPAVMMQGDIYAVYFAEFSPAGTSSKVLSAELLSKAGTRAEAEAFPPGDPEVIELLQKGQVLQAIKAYRALHPSSLEEARGMVEQLRTRLEG